MNNSREKFEAWYQTQFSEIVDFSLFAPTSAYYKDDDIDEAWDVWQAATEQSQKEIAELEANNAKVTLALASIRDIFEYDDEMVRSGALSYPEDVAGFVKTKVAELKARDKVLVEALKSAKPVYATAKNTKAVKTGHELGGYVKDYLVSPHILHNALANVRGEVK